MWPTFVTTQMPTPVLWQDIESFRRLWPGKLVLKGIMHPDDATRAAAIGVDGIMVSNHGARQLDRAPSPIEVLPAINAAVGEKMTVMFDSGIRRGSDVITALCLGAKYVFVGRPTLYGVTAGGAPGATRALDIFRNEIDLVMAQHGRARHQEPGPAVPDVEGRGRPAPQRAPLRRQRSSISLREATTRAGSLIAGAGAQARARNGLDGGPSPAQIAATRTRGEKGCQRWVDRSGVAARAAGADIGSRARRTLPQDFGRLPSC